MNSNAATVKMRCVLMVGFCAGAGESQARTVAVSRWQAGSGKTCAAPLSQDVGREVEAADDDFERSLANVAAFVEGHGEGSRAACVQRAGVGA